MMISYVGHTRSRLESAFQDEILPLTWLLLDDQRLDEVIRRLEPRRVAKRLKPVAGSVLPEMRPRPSRPVDDVYQNFWNRTVGGELPLRRDKGYLVSRAFTTDSGTTIPAGRCVGGAPSPQKPRHRIRWRICLACASRRDSKAKNVLLG